MKKANLGSAPVLNSDTVGDEIVAEDPHLKISLRKV
jgi:hypothetical protein